MSGSERRTCGRSLQILVAGPGDCGRHDLDLAEETGRLLAQAGAVLLTGGRGGAMEASCRGAHAAGGTVLAVLPGADASETPANIHVDLAVFTGMGHARNAILAASADAVIAIGGGWGTLSEIALARALGRPVVLLHSWRLAPCDRNPIETPLPASSPAEAVAMALAAAAHARRS